MENAANALKIAFAIIMLVLAITATFSIISQAKETADAVFFASDETNFYDMSSMTKYSDSNKRVVEKDTVISTLYRLYDESLCVTIIEKADPTDPKVFNSNDYKSKKEAYNVISAYCESLTGNEFFESYQEVKTSGIYQYADDGSELIETPGSTKIYITYVED
ncbi:MAG: hypothetical protein IJN50_06155 [Clostridia bacterium]|nr:hypothetical protein [Clostridia bacterium]